MEAEAVLQGDELERVKNGELDTKVSSFEISN